MTVVFEVIRKYVYWIKHWSDVRTIWFVFGTYRVTSCYWHL